MTLFLCKKKQKKTCLKPSKQYFIPKEMNTSEPWAVSAPSTTCQEWLMSSANPHPPCLCSLSFTNNVHQLQPGSRAHTGCSYRTFGEWHCWLHALRGTQRKMDRQELSAGRQAHQVSLSLQCKASARAQLDPTIIISAWVALPNQDVNCWLIWRGCR